MVSKRTMFIYAWQQETSRTKMIKLTNKKLVQGTIIYKQRRKKNVKLTIQWKFKDKEKEMKHKLMVELRLQK